MRAPLIAAAVACVIGAVPVSGQFRTGHPPEDLATYDWTAWLVGAWEGTWETEAGVQPYRQSFELSPDRRYILTHNERGAGDAAYRGFGVFSYYPTTGEAYGQWFGMQHDTNDGWAIRDGETMRWTIRRLGMRITRVRTRTGPDSYVVENEVLTPEGAVSRSREVMTRTKPS